MEEKEDKNSFSIIIPIAIIILAFGVAYASYQSGKVKTEKNIVTIPSPTPYEIISSPAPEATPTATESAMIIPSDWKYFNETGTNVRFYYPPDFDISKNSNGSVNLGIWGPTQTADTELFDGIGLTISTSVFTEENFLNFVETKWNEASQSAVTTVGDIEESSINGKTAYQYEEEGLGVFTNIYIPFEGKNYIHVSALVSDPTNAGFQETVNKILSTIEYKKLILYSRDS